MTSSPDTSQHDRRRESQCPPWCSTNHKIPGLSHVGDTGSISFGDRNLDSMWAAPLWREDYHKRPIVTVTGHWFGKNDSWQVSVRELHETGDLAAMVEMLASASPEQHRELAAAIRKAAADIVGEK